METWDAEGQLCNSEMWKMGILKRKMAFYRNKRKQFPHKRQENTFHTPMPAGQSLTWKMHMHRT